MHLIYVDKKFLLKDSYTVLLKRKLCKYSLEFYSLNLCKCVNMILYVQTSIFYIMIMIRDYNLANLARYFYLYLPPKLDI